MPVKTLPATGCVTTTTGTGTYAIGSALTQDGVTLFTFSEAVGFGWLTDGDVLYLAIKNASGGLEEGEYTYNHAGQTLARTTVRRSTNGGAAVSWGAGNKSLFSCWPSLGIALTANNLSDVANAALSRGNLGSTTVGDALFITASAAAARTTLGLGTAATANTGTGANNVPVLDGSGIFPQLTGPLPALQGVSGGTDGKVVRLSGSGTATDAANTDTQVQLCSLLFKVNSRYYRPGERVSGLSSLSAGSNYWLGTAGAITTTPPTPSPTVCSVYLGKALSTTEFLFNPMLPVKGA